MAPFPEDLVRECRFAPGPSEQVAALVPEDPTVWVVEWAVKLHGLSEAAARSWQTRLTEAGLILRERQPIAPRPQPPRPRDP